MEIFGLLLVVSIAVAFFFKRKKTEPRRSATKTVLLDENVSADEKLFQMLKNELRQFVVKRKNGKILVCEIDNRGEPKELAFISMNPLGKKTVEKKDGFWAITYREMPSAEQVRKDLGL